jgi:hypothetical protein
VNHVKEAKRLFITRYELKIGNHDPIPPEFTERWADWRKKAIQAHSGFAADDLADYRPAAQKSLILNWIAFWPFSAVGLFVADPLKKLVVGIYNQLGSVYDRIYDHTISKLINKSDLD